MNTNEKKGIFSNKVAIILLVALVVINIDYIGAIIENTKHYSSQILQFYTYIFGYLLTDICIIAAISDVVKGKKEMLTSLWLTFAAMVTMLVCDFFVSYTDGLHLSGLFSSMVIYLVMDVLLLLFIFLLIRTQKKAYAGGALIISAIYCAGELLGYPLNTFGDWDEFFLMFCFLLVFAVKYFVNSKPDKA